MKTIITWTSVFMTLAALAFAGVPQTITYQGFLKSPVGAPVNESKSMVFSLYAVSTGGTPIWTEIQPAVTVANGVYSVLLGSVTPLTATLFSTTDVYLGIAIGTDPEMTPRQKLTSAGFAFKAADADSVGGKASSSFAPSAHNHSGTYVQNAGDTMSGALSLPANGLTVGGTQLVLSGGNVGIGTTVPVEKLDVAGTVKAQGLQVTTGAAAGRVFTSNAVGQATWQALPADGDSSATNELQNLGLIGNTLSISSGNNVDLSATGSDTLAALNCADGEVAIYKTAQGFWACGANSGVTPPDNLGNHTATANIILGAHYLSGDGDDEGLVIDTSGGVGIGTALPIAKLDVVPNRFVYGNWTAYDFAGSCKYHCIDTCDGNLSAKYHCPENATEPTTCEDITNYVVSPGGDTDLEFRTVECGRYPNAARFDGDVIVNGSIMGSKYLSGDGSSEGIAIDAAGNVGIGTNSATEKLTVAGAVKSLSGGFIFPDQTAQTKAAFGDGHSLDGDAGGPIDALYVDATGKIGIGTATPTETLDVAGSLSVRPFKYLYTYVGGGGIAPMNYHPCSCNTTYTDIECLNA